MQAAILLTASLFAAYLGTQSQPSGIGPLGAFVCPSLGIWSFSFGPNSRPLSEWNGPMWAYAWGSILVLAISTGASLRANRPVIVYLSVTACFLATLFWVLLGLGRVGYSMG